MIKLVLVRHGESVWNLENRFTGWTDVSLSDKGVLESKEAGKLIKKSKIIFNNAFTSVLKRATKTLEIICCELKQQFPIYKDWRLNERHYGALQGLNKKETAKKFGEKQVQLWRRSANTKPPMLKKNDERNPRFDSLYDEIKEKLPLGESLLDTEKRVVKCFNKLIKIKTKNGDNVLLVAHGNSIRALIKYLDNIDEKNISKLEIPTGKPIVYELDEKFKPIRHYYLNEKD